VFDFGGVLGPRSNTWDTTHKNISELTGIPPEKLSELSKNFWPILETGKASITDFWEKVIEMSDREVDMDELEQIYESNFKADNGSLSLAKELKRMGFQVVILSNASKEWMEFKKDKFKLEEVFDKIYSSADLGMMKPDHTIYQYVLRDLKIHPSEAVFIDDHDQNLEVAKAEGMTIVKFTNAKEVREKIMNLLKSDQ